jgi:transcriptional regulator with XRE-family HTH domain
MTQNGTIGKFDDLGERIRQARVEAGWTIEALARELNVSTRTVAGWQSGRQQRSRPSYERLARLSELLGKPVSYFLGEDDDGRAAA